MLEDKKKKYLFFTSLIFLNVFILLSLKSFLGNDKFLFAIKDDKTLAMYIESVILIALFVMSFFLKKRLAFLSFFIIFILWLHQILLALSVAFIFVLALTLFGEVLLIKIRKSEKIFYEREIIRYSHSFSTGLMFYIFLICLFSFFNLASIDNIIFLTFSFCVIAILLYVLAYINSYILNCVYIKDKEEENKISNVFLFCIAFILLFQALRLNISIDYDSIRYTLRSKHILFLMNNIYKNTGLVNQVYVYPKGFEILTAGLNIFSSYSFIQAFSFMCYILFLLLSYDLIAYESNRKNAIFGVLLLSFIPSIANMGISAKTDMITLLFQMAAVLDFIYFIKKRDTYYFIYFLIAISLSTIFKPSSVFFSGIIFICVLFYLILNKVKLSFKKNLIVLLFSSFLATFLVHLRTYIISGHFYVGFLVNILKLFGFEYKYPYNLKTSIPSTIDYADFIGKVKLVLKRVYSLFFNPLRYDEKHIYIAFASASIICFVIFTYIALIVFKNKKVEKTSKMIIVINVVLFISSLYTLSFLYQVDGNYYILIYAMSIISYLLIYQAEIEKFYKKIVYFIFIFLVSNFLLISVTSWAGNLGFSKINTLSYGYYPHIKDNEDVFFNKGIFKIYSYLKERQKEKLVSIADHSLSMLFENNVESYTDIVGSGGNVYLVKYLDNFKEYLDFTNTSYIFVSDDFLQDNSRAKEIVSYMLEDGSLKLLINEGTYKLYTYEKR